MPSRFAQFLDHRLAAELVPRGRPHGQLSLPPVDDRQSPAGLEGSREMLQVIQPPIDVVPGIDREDQIELACGQLRIVRFGEQGDDVLVRGQVLALLKGPRHPVKAGSKPKRKMAA